MSLEDESRVVGFLAHDHGGRVFRHQDACVVSGSEHSLRAYLDTGPLRSADQLTIAKTRFGEILAHLQHGAAYVFDQQAYTRFQPLAVRAGVDAPVEEFPDQDSGQFHFVRIELS